MKPYISVILTSRGRPHQLESSLDSLYKNCFHKDNYEVIVIFDEDDIDTINHFLKIEKNYNFKILITKRYGYHFLHLQQNMAVKLADGEWFWIWNDDSTVESENWDLIIKEHDGEFAVLSTHGLHAPEWEKQHPPFPIIPKKWVEILGNLSSWAYLDTYIVKLNESLGFIKHEERIKFYHNWDKDQNFEERSSIPKLPFPQDEFTNDLQKIRTYLLT